MVDWFWYNFIAKRNYTYKKLYAIYWCNRGDTPTKAWVKASHNMRRFHRCRDKWPRIKLP